MVKKELVPLTKSKAYSRFVKDRDKAAEKILANYQKAFAQIVDVLNTRAKEIAAHICATATMKGKHLAKRNKENFEQRLTPMFKLAVPQSVALLSGMRRSTYVLTAAGAAEAIGRALQTPSTVKLTAADLQKEQSRETPSGGSPQSRVELYYDRLLAKVVHAFQLSQVLESSSEETLDRIDRAFPPARRIPKRAPMAKLTESKRQNPKSGDETAEPTVEGASLDFSLVDPVAWDQMVEDYAADYLPFGRGPYDQVFYPTTIASDETEDTLMGYMWELEQEVTNDFIQGVRNGENDGANQNGITDFQWIAVIDAKTDECCSSRDGLTTEEIGKKIDAGEDMGDCDAESAPAHLHCRCRMAPMTDDMPEAEEPDFAGFDSWLEDKENAA